MRKLLLILYFLFTCTSMAQSLQGTWTMYKYESSTDTDYFLYSLNFDENNNLESQINDSLIICHSKEGGELHIKKEVIPLEYTLDCTSGADYEPWQLYFSQTEEDTHDKFYVYTSRNLDLVFTLVKNEDNIKN